MKVLDKLYNFQCLLTADRINILKLESFDTLKNRILKCFSCLFVEEKTKIMTNICQSQISVESKLFVQTKYICECMNQQRYQHFMLKISYVRVGTIFR